MLNYADGFYEFDDNLVDETPMDILNYISVYHLRFHDKWLGENSEYHSSIIPTRNPPYHDDFLTAIALFRRTKRTYKLYHPISNFRAIVPCEICKLLPVGRIYGAWDERDNRHRPWGKRNKKSGRLQRCGSRKKICFECRVRFCCRCVGCAININDHKIPPTGMKKCLNCLAKYLDINE